MFIKMLGTLLNHLVREIDTQYKIVQNIRAASGIN